MFFRGSLKRTFVIGWVTCALVLVNLNPAHAVPDLLFNNSPSSVCSSGYTSNAIHTNRFVAQSSVRITNIDAYIGTGSQTNFSTSKYFLMSDNPSLNVPLTVLETFTPSSISGTGTSTLARYVGTYTIQAGTKFWIVPGQYASNFPICYNTGISATAFTMNGILIDTSTTLSNSSFSRAYNVTSSNVYGGSWVSVSDSYGWQLTLSGSITSSAVSVTVSLQSGLRTAVYRTPTTITSTVDSASKVSFFANNKIISGCRSILSSAGSATCNWMPSLHGSIRLSARAIPINSALTSATATSDVSVIARTNQR